MKPEIKQRIEQINDGQVPNGYKKTDFGVFPCDWVTDKFFGDLFTFNGGLGKSRDELSEDGIEYLHYGDMHRSDFNIASMEHYSQLPKYDTNLKGDEPYLMQDGDVAFLDASEDLEGTSRAVLIDNPDNKPFIAGLHIIHGKSKGNELSKYYKQYITQPDYIKKQFQKFASGFKVYGINRNTITKVKCAYPESNSEQEKIAEILMKWDEAIELQEKYIEKLKLLKSAHLSNMFPRGKEKKPKVRFHGFSDDWEQRKLGEVSESYSGGTPSVGVKEYYNGTIPFIRSAEINSDTTELFITESGLKNSSARYVNIGDILYALYGATSGEVGRAKIKGAINQAILAIIPQEKYDIEFIAQWLKKSKGNIINTYLQGGQGNLSGSIVKELVIDFPNYEEQKLIGKHFQNLDNLIALHQDKLEKLKSQRKVLQQYLLNGIVRISR